MNKYRSLLFICSSLVLSVFPAWSADYYIAQSATGANDATSCANAKAVTWDWTSPNVVEGDIIHLCGTFTSTLTIPQSFASAVTVKFETGAKFSKAAWGTDSNAAIYAAGKNNIIIDGDNVGTIENTDNGTALGTQQYSYGIYIGNGSNWTIKNLIFSNLYQRTPRVAGDLSEYGVGIYSLNISSLTINNNTFEDMYYGILSSATTGDPSVLNIHHNDLSRMSTGIVVRLDDSTNYSDINIYNNKIYDTYVWDGCSGGTGVDQCTGGSWHHRDGIHTWGNYSGKSLGPIKIYNNEFSGDWGISGHSTGFVFLTDYTYPALVYNNTFIPSAGTASNGDVVYHCYTASGSVSVYNNTFKGPGATNIGGNAVFLSGAGGGNASIKNNIITSVYIGIYDDTTNGTVFTNDNNDFYNIGSVGRIINSWYGTLSDWQNHLGAGNEGNSITTDPLLTETYTISANSPAVDAGIDLSAYFTTDKSGVSRPQRSAWDIGAYEQSIQKFHGNVMIGGAGLFN